MGMSDTSGQLLRLLLCGIFALGGVGASASNADARGDGRHDRSYKRWQYRPNVWRHQRHGAKRWRSKPRYRRAPRRPVYVPPPERRLVGPGWVWVPAVPPRGFQKPRRYVVPPRPAPHPQPHPFHVAPNGTGTHSAPGPHGLTQPEIRPGTKTPVQPPTPHPKHRVQTRATSAQLPPPDPRGVLGDTYTAGIAKQVLELINRERAARRLKPLSPNVRLGAAAWLHSREMYQRRYFSHRSPNRLSASFTDRIRNAGVVKHGAAGENIAMTHLSRDVATRLVQMWMASPGHRANILHKDFQFSGLGIFGDGDYIYATHVFTQAVRTPKIRQPHKKGPRTQKTESPGPSRVI